MLVKGANDGYLNGTPP